MIYASNWQSSCAPMAWVTLVIVLRYQVPSGPKKTDYAALSSSLLLTTLPGSAVLSSSSCVTMSWLSCHMFDFFSPILCISTSDLFIVWEVDSYSQGAAGTVQHPEEGCRAPQRAHLSSTSKSIHSCLTNDSCLSISCVYSIYHSSIRYVHAPWVESPSLGSAKLDPYLCKQGHITTKSKPDKRRFGIWKNC